MTASAGKKLENPIKIPVENPNLTPEQGGGQESGRIEFERSASTIKNPDKNPTKEKGPVKLPGKKSVEKEILSQPSESRDQEDLSSPSQRPSEKTEPRKKIA